MSSTTPGGGSLGFEGHQPRVVPTYPWTGKPWAEEAEAANRGMNGQGYIVHAVRLVNRYGLPLAVTVVLLMLVQIAISLWQVCLTYKGME